MSTTRSSRRRRSANQTEDFIPPDANISSGGVNTRRRNIKKQNENSDINSDTSTNMDFVTPNTKLTRKRQTNSVIKELKQAKSERKAVLKERNKESKIEPTSDKKIDLEVNDNLVETRSSVRKTTRGRKKQISDLSDESISVDAKEIFSAEKLSKKNRKGKTKKQYKKNDTSDNTSKESQSTNDTVCAAETLDHTTAEKVHPKNVGQETSLDISGESFHSAAGGSLIDSIESPDLKSSFDKNRDSLRQSLKKISPIKSLTPIKTTITKNLSNITIEKSSETKKQLLIAETATADHILNTTFDKSTDTCKSMMKTATSKIEHILNTTFEKSAEDKILNGSDNTQRSRLESTDLLNTSPFLINDSFLQDDNDDLQNAVKKSTPKSIPKKKNSVISSETTSSLAKTPLRKEGTFIMDSTVKSTSPSTDTHKLIEDVLDNEANISDLDKTPENNHRTMSLPGSTPYHRETRSNAKNSKRNKSLLFNITHSIEKDKSGGRRRSSSAQPKSTIKTRVAFCSPVPKPTSKESQGVNEKIIKSSLKGSNKSFVYKESDNKKPSSRKRSMTCNDANDSQLSKRRCMTQSELNTSVNRLSKPKTPGSQGKRSSPLTNFKNTTPSKKTTTPSKSIKVKAVSESKLMTGSETKSKANSERKSKTGSETKQPSRSKLPNFAALHKKQFDKMESLNECQERKARRAVQLLKSPKVPTLSKNLFGTIDEKKKQKLTTTTNKDNSYNRFGFKNSKVFDSVTTNSPKTEIDPGKNADANIFSIPSVSESVLQKNSKANIFTITTTAPKPETKTKTIKLFASRVDSGLSRKDNSRQVVMRERNTSSVLAKNKMESRDFIRGVRTNRRFELQMKQRNLNC